MLIIQKFAGDVDRAGLRDAWKLLASPAASARVLPATEAEIDLDGRQLVSEKRVVCLPGETDGVRLKSFCCSTFHCILDTLERFPCCWFFFQNCFFIRAQPGVSS